MATKNAIKAFESMPGPKGFPVIGNLLKYVREEDRTVAQLRILRDKYSKQFGEIYKEKIWNSYRVYLHNAEDILQVLRKEGKYPERQKIPAFVALKKFHKVHHALLENGEDWWDSRKKLQRPMLKPDAGKEYFSDQCEVADDLITYIKKNSKDGIIDDTATMFMRYTMESIGIVSFGTRIRVLSNEIDATGFLDTLNNFFDLLFKSFFVPPYKFKYKSKFYMDFYESDKGMRDYSKQYASEHAEEKQSLYKVSIKNGLNKEEAAVMAAGLISAGVESTTNSLLFFFFNLSRNPEKQEKLHQEIKLVLKEGPLTYDRLNDMKYLKACLKESMRIYFPVLDGASRVLNEDIILKNYNIPKGTVIIFNSAQMAKREDYFYDADKFIPERWLRSENQEKKIPLGASLPFGLGKRMCIGRRFAEQEIYLGAVKLLNAFRVEENGDDINQTLSTFLKPDRQMNFKFIDRQN